MNVKITVLSKEDCHYCDVAKDMFVRLQDEYDFDLEFIDITSNDGIELSKDFGLFFPPGILINGKPFSYGRPSEKKVKKAIVRLLK